MATANGSIAKPASSGLRPRPFCRNCGNSEAITCAQAAYHDDGSFTIVLSERDPGVANWLEAAHHRDGHIAIRWQLTDTLPIPECTVVPVEEVAARTGLPSVDPAERDSQRRALHVAFDDRFRP